MYKIRDMKTVYPKSPIWNYNDWIRYIHNEVMKQKKFKKDE
jgi:hypothetical protein